MSEVVEGEIIFFFCSSFGGDGSWGFGLVWFGLV